jgi:hypothetical protein
MTAPGRKLIGKSSSFMGREAVWQMSEGFEIQSKERFEVERKRVLFEEILFVTYHRMYGGIYLALTGVFALFFFAIAFVIIAAGGFDGWPFALAFALIGLPALIAFLLRLMFRLDVITVFGKRTKASIRFRLRKQRARSVYTQITTAVRMAQERMRRELAREETRVEPEVPVEEITDLMPPEETFPPA